MFRYVLIETDEKYPDILAFYERNQDFFALSQNSAVTLAQVDADVQAGPKDLAPENKRYFLITDDNETPIAVLDYALGYPDVQTVFIGLLIVDQHFRGQGIGRAIVAEQLTYFRSIGMTKVRLAVLENNPAGLAFWQGLGFEIVDASKRSTDGDLVHVLRYRLSEK
jgi:ribosomal protein S18 acetylase RimI-like enzyme